MIGWYIHHQGRGHLHRATAVAQAAAARGMQITGISSLPEPSDWPGEAGWVQLDRDDTAGEDDGGFREPTASGALHWAPLRHAGLRRRSAQLSAWIDHAAPQLLVADVSVEIALLARLHGIPVVTVALPGDRNDPAHRLGYGISSAVVGMWPAEASGIFHGAAEVHALGGLSRFSPESRAGSAERVTQDHRDTAKRTEPEDRQSEVLVLSGGGGGAVTDAAIAQLRRVLPQARLRVLGGEGSWEADPWPLLIRADLVLTAAGQNSIAEIAASRTPALVTALDRPHQEQDHMLDALERGPWPVLRAPEPGDDAGWDRAVNQALALEGQDWASWSDGAAADRFAELLHSMLPAPATPAEDTPRAVVVTAVHGRATHLRRQRAALALSAPPAVAHVVVAMEDPEVSARLAAAQPGTHHATKAGVTGHAAELPTQVWEIPRSAGRLPLAAARNLGAQRALEQLPGPDDLLIFLDVDCIPDPGLISAYIEASRLRPEDLLCGPVAYLPELPGEALDAATAEQLAAWAEPHPARPAPAPGEIQTHGEHALFWSLSFAVRRDVWETIGGFDEAYTGYGAEDTDFSWRARAHGVELTWVGGARAYHQHHPVSRPPVEHLTDILRNGRIFADRWGHWPMEGWLQEFERMGLVHRKREDWVASQDPQQRTGQATARATEQDSTGRSA
ncbi:glycosyltransferase family 2 protein [Nesterenkonia sp. CF4.4]|uniref:glycosyltransferase family 2 protein n=1 Tax=Nesterenkonia sp. CF4.4 TaxID=3373079 RepID=UPI003EE7A88E